MSTVTLTRPRGLARPTADARPCTVLPAQWWDTGNANNATAIEICNAPCPFKAKCPAENPQPRSTVVAGVPYDDRGQALALCPTCHQPPIYHPGKPGMPLTCQCSAPKTASDWHDQIMSMRAAGKLWSEVAAVTGLPTTTLRAYSERARSRPTGKPGRPADHHDTIAEMRGDGYGWAEIALAINASREAVKCYWRRQSRQSA